jgi:hypothetical protein
MLMARVAARVAFAAQHRCQSSTAATQVAHRSDKLPRLGRRRAPSESATVEERLDRAFSRPGRGGGHAPGGGPNKHKHMHLALNRIILSYNNPAALTALVAARAADFNHVNVATALRLMMMAQNRDRRSDAQQDLPHHASQDALQTLEECALRKMGEFEAREVANLLHAMAKTGYRPAQSSLLAELERRVELKASNFTPQGVSNTLWAWASMHRRPSEGPMKALDARVEAIAHTFHSQAVANSLWAWAKLGRRPAEGALAALERRAEHIVHEFKSQEVANALWAIAKLGRVPTERLLCVLEKRAEAISNTFNAREVSNTLWAIAKISQVSGRKASEDALWALEQRVLTLSGIFNTVEVSNTLMSLSTLGRRSRQDVLQALEARAGTWAGDFVCCASRVLVGWWVSSRC